MQSLHKNRTWELVTLPKGKKEIGCKWVYAKKEGFPGKNEIRYKARLVAKVYVQKEGIDYNEVFSLVVKHSSIRFLLALVAQYDLELVQLDVKPVFLHSDLEEEIYMTQPDGFKVANKENWVCKLTKSLYGLKQSSRQWYKRFDQFMKGQRYTRSKFDHCVYFQKLQEGIFVYLLLYVDDMLIASKSKVEIERLKTQLNFEFEMKDLGEAKKILGMEICRDRAHERLFAQLSPSTNTKQEYMLQVLYSNAVGSLMYAMVCTRPDIPQYIQKTMDVGLLFKQDTTLGKGVIGGPISWKSTLQSTVALLTTKAEYIAITEAVKEAIWLQGMVKTLGLVQEHINVYCDSQSAIHLAKNQVYHARTKHIDVRFHFVLEIIDERKNSSSED
ncbi:hypothetical protein CXB51_019640 [Gossypium anomalum]|uniref:Reverse transcriptase Ty1/copia-type domain-containing protein n=1 Tax=Gossypium anomalum TaxID=47600 RepID=A0A8J5YP51_9ROSI|nr:hypothetical protein CXB51_019640 [Gossypium anomalum]